MTRALFLFPVLAAGMLAVSAHAQDPTEVIAVADKTIHVESGQGELVRLERPISSVFVADPNTADVQLVPKSQSLVYLLGKKAGSTTLFAVDGADKVVLNTRVEVTYNLTRIREAIHEAVPHAAVSVTSVDNALVLDGVVYSAADADNVVRVAKQFLPEVQEKASWFGGTNKNDNDNLLVNRLKIDAPNQVNLRVRIAEVSRDVVKQFGFNWDAAIRKGSMVFGLATNNPTAGGGPLGFATRGTASSGKDTFDNLFGSATLGNADLNAVIDALDSNGLATILAEPNLTAVSGEKASFLAGGEFPIPVSSSVAGGFNTVTVQWKQFGVSLSFVATIAAANRINLHVIPEVSEVSNTNAVNISGIQLPSIVTRRADTTVELASGQSIALAGLLQNNVTQALKKFPWLGDIPILGQLFRSDAFQRQETELVIIVTPYIVRPVSTANRLRSPADGYVPSSDGDMVFTGAEYKSQVLNKSGGPVSPSGTGLIGPVGFDLD